MLLATWLLAAVLLTQDSVAPLESGVVRSVELESAPGTWAQYFRIDREGASRTAAPFGLMRYVAGPDRDGGVHVDLELQYLSEGLRVLHTERASRLNRRLVFREIRAGSGRTLFLEGTPAAGYEGYELGVREVVRHQRMGSGELPLLLIEAARLGRELPEETSVLDPLAAGFEVLKLTRRDAGEERVFEARRPDGGLRWRVSVRGQELSEWRFQDSGPLARAISQEEFQHLQEANELQVRAAREAAATTESVPGPPRR